MAAISSRHYFTKIYCQQLLLTWFNKICCGEMALYLMQSNWQATPEWYIFYAYTRFVFWVCIIIIIISSSSSSFNSLRPSELTIIGSDNGLSPERHQAIIWTNAGILLIGPLGTNFSEILIEIQTFSLKKMRLKISSGKCRPFCIGLDVLIYPQHRSSVMSPH